MATSNFSIVSVKLTLWAEHFLPFQNAYSCLLMTPFIQDTDAQWVASQIQSYLVKECLQSSWSVTNQALSSP